MKRMWNGGKISRRLHRMDWCWFEGSEAAALRAGTGPLGGVAEDRQRSVRTGWSEGREPHLAAIP